MEPWKIESHLLGRLEDGTRVYVSAEWRDLQLSLVGHTIAKGCRNWASAGQTRNAVHDLNPELAELWARWHLNYMRAGCAHQETRFRATPASRPSYRNDYAGMKTPCPECGYLYGTAWNHEPVPNEVLARIKAILS